jgi:hypothetical protein
VWSLFDARIAGEKALRSTVDLPVVSDPEDKTKRTSDPRVLGDGHCGRRASLIRLRHSREISAGERKNDRRKE